MKVKLYERLSRTFHRTFKPERIYLTALLRFAAAGKMGDIAFISSETGIPSGESSGKVQPSIDYCVAMGLLEVECKDKEYSFALTEFGRSAFLEDPYLKNPITLWIAHCNLCHPTHGADVWFKTFVEYAELLGMSFSRKELEDTLRSSYGESGRNPIGPLISMYTDVASFGGAQVLTDDGKSILREPAPLKLEYHRAYGAWLLQLMSDFFPTERQISITELERRSGWKRVTSWHPAVITELLVSLERLGMIRVDRHMSPWLLEGSISPEMAWRNMYDDIL